MLWDLYVWFLIQILFLKFSQKYVENLIDCSRESFAALEFDYKYYDIESNEIEESEDIE